MPARHAGSAAGPRFFVLTRRRAIPGLNAFEGLHEARMRGTEITPCPDDMDLLFDLLHDEILNANVKFLQCARRRVR